MPAAPLEADGFPTRLVRALPDAATAAVFMWVWLDPSDWRRNLVAQGILILLLEFILIHSGAFFGHALSAPDMARGKRLKILLGLGLLYSIFVGAWAWQFKAWWPLLFFLWLLGSKLVPVLANRNEPDEARWRAIGLVAASTIFFLLAVPAALFLPLPELGLTRHGRHYGVPGSGAWVSQPHTAIAAAVIYFGLLALAKLLAWDTVFAQNAQRQQANRG